MIELKELTKKYGKQIALDHFSLQLPNKGIIGVLGPNGSGKTTLFNTMTQLTNPTKGLVKINDQVLFNYNDKKRNHTLPQSMISYIADNQKYYSLTVIELIDLFSMMFKDFNKTKMIELMEVFNITIQSKIKTLTKGKKACLGMALTISRDVDCYILDEPFDGIDIEIRNHIIDNLIEYIDSENKLLLISSHEVRDIERLLDYFIYLDEGKLIEFKKTSSIREEEGLNLTEWLLKKMDGDLDDETW